MRYMLLALFVLFAAQPSLASFCDMCAGQKASHADMADDKHTTTDMHADMGHGMDHSNDSNKMDCCDDDQPSDKDDHCSGMAHCGANSASSVAISPSISPLVISTARMTLDFSADPPLYRSSSPPFRPPIS